MPITQENQGNECNSRRGSSTGVDVCSDTGGGRSPAVYRTEGRSTDTSESRRDVREADCGLGSHLRATCRSPSSTPTSSPFGWVLQVEGKGNESPHVELSAAANVKKCRQTRSPAQSAFARGWCHVIDLRRPPFKAILPALMKTALLVAASRVILRDCRLHGVHWWRRSALSCCVEQCRRLHAPSWPSNPEKMEEMAVARTSLCIPRWPHQAQCRRDGCSRSLPY